MSPLSILDPRFERLGRKWMCPELVEGHRKGATLQDVP
jgi:hypothetical protein